RRSVIVPDQRWSPRIIQCNQLSGGHVMDTSNEYLNQVVAEQAQVEGELKARKQAPPARGRGIFNRVVAVRRVVGPGEGAGGGEPCPGGPGPSFPTPRAWGVESRGRAPQALRRPTPAAPTRSRSTSAWASPSPTTPPQTPSLSSPPSSRRCSSTPAASA